MALTITIEGKGIIANADNETNDTGGTGTGDWFELGGGTIAESGVAVQGGDAIAGGYSNKDGWQYFDIGAGNELDFDTSGTEEGQLIYMWVQMPALAQLDTIGNEGLSVRLGSSTTVYHNWTFAGNDDSNGWIGGYKCFVLDPTKTPTSNNGTLDLSSIRHFGFYINTSSAGRGDNFFADRIVVSSGIRITGTSTQGWKDVVDYCTASANALGFFEEREGIYYCKANVIIGDTTQTSVTSFVDSGRIIKFETCEYYNSSAAWASSVNTSDFGITIEDASGYATTFTDGVVVGTDKGRAGSTIIGSSNEAIFLDLHGGNNAASVTTCYGTKFEGITGTFNFGNDSDYKLYSCTFVGCSQIDPVGAPAIRNCIFAETIDTDSALLWNENIDIESCSFIANTTGSAIEMPSAAGTPYEYTNLVFSGNSPYDVLNSSGSAISIAKTGTSNPTTYEGSSVTFTGSVSITIACVDPDNDPVGNIRCSIFRASDDLELLNEDSNATTGLAIDSVDIPGSPYDIYWRVRESPAAGPRYKPKSGVGEITTNGFSVTVTMELETVTESEAPTVETEMEDTLEMLDATEMV